MKCLLGKKNGHVKIPFHILVVRKYLISKLSYSLACLSRQRTYLNNNLNYFHNMLPPSWNLPRWNRQRGFFKQRIGFGGINDVSTYGRSGRGRAWARSVTGFVRISCFRKERRRVMDAEKLSLRRLQGIRRFRHLRIRWIW
ncbi:hypothetical protein WAI453_000269 [Rhynchosporium graminicola]